jgi:hypothetical protein
MVSILNTFSRCLPLAPGVLMKIQFDSDQNLGNRIFISKVKINYYGEDDDSGSSRIRSIISYYKLLLILKGKTKTKETSFTFTFVQ